MTNNIFDTHAHYDDVAFNDDRDEIIGRLKGKGVCRVVNAGADILSSKKSIELSKKYDFFCAAVGVHPLNLGGLEENYLDSLSQLVDCNTKVVAIGEIGLDYHIQPFFSDDQKNVFASQVNLAKSYNLPVIVHSRDADIDSFEIIKKYRPKGIVHCFSGNLDLAKELIRLGIYIGVGGVLTFKNAKKLVEVVSNVSLDNIVLETDCPYMAPVPLRGKRCDSSMIIYVAEKISLLKNIPLEDVLKITRENAEKVFNLSWFVSCIKNN